MSTHAARVLHIVATRRNLSRMTHTAAVDAAVSAIDYTIGENVETLRRRAGLSVAELGAQFQLSGSAMSLKLRGKRSWSALDTHLAARLFGVRMAQLQGEEALPEPSAPASVTDISDLIAKRRSVGRTGLEPVTDGL